jgi:excisionase family DNA binding protein
MDTEFLTPAEVAQRLRVDDVTVRRWIHSGMLEAEEIHQGRRRRYLVKKSTVEVIERRTPERHRKRVWTFLLVVANCRHNVYCSDRVTHAMLSKSPAEVATETGRPSRGVGNCYLDKGRARSRRT